MDSEPAEPGRIWTSPTRSAVAGKSAARRATGVAQARDQTVLKRLLRRIAG